MRNAPGNTDLLDRIARKGLFRTSEAQGAGIGRSSLRQLVLRGEVERVARGLYRLESGPLTEHFTVAAVCASAPSAVVCLLSALRMHDIGTQAPRQVWIAVDRKAWKPRLVGLPVRIVRFSGAGLTHGIQVRRLQGIRVRLTTPARTVVDCFKYRNKIGLDVALEALRETIHGRKATPAEIMEVARMRRMERVMRPYVEGFGI
jgi:predicted transcriptional regulator of viral defense system